MISPPSAQTQPWRHRQNLSFVPTQGHVRGRFLYNTPLHSMTWLQVGGATPLMFHPADVEDLSLFLKVCHNINLLRCVYEKTVSSGAWIYHKQAAAHDFATWALRAHPHILSPLHRLPTSLQQVSGENHTEDQCAHDTQCAGMTQTHRPHKVCTDDAPHAHVGCHTDKHDGVFSGICTHQEAQHTPQSPSEHIHHPARACLVSLCYGAPLILGAGSNLLVRDAGTWRIVIKMGKGFHQVAQDGTRLTLGAGVRNRYAAHYAEAAGLSGLEFLFTIPGTIGGGLAMNAGCFGSDFSKVLEWAHVMDPQGEVHTILTKDLAYGYRCHGMPENWIFLQGTFALSPQTSPVIAAQMQRMMEQRNATQPTQVKTGGSTFANPPHCSAWQLIHEVGFRGARKGGAQFSQKHCNFLINHGHATAWELESLGEEARQEIFRQKGIWLKWEILRWGCQPHMA